MPQVPRQVHHAMEKASLPAVRADLLQQLLLYQAAAADGAIGQWVVIVNESTIVSEGFKGGTRGAPIMPRDAVSRTANVGIKGNC